ncbi:unnamed protein product [Amoebophrya sp. A25]|nr:unnamed protein product [Amoebophrya sp. A25]|eukprot:GSA25T00020036001.1
MTDLGLHLLPWVVVPGFEEENVRIRIFGAKIPKTQSWVYVPLIASALGQLPGFRFDRKLHTGQFSFSSEKQIVDAQAFWRSVFSRWDMWVNDLRDGILRKFGNVDHCNIFHVRSISWTTTLVFGHPREFGTLPHPSGKWQEDLIDSCLDHKYQSELFASILTIGQYKPQQDQFGIVQHFSDKSSAVSGLGGPPAGKNGKFYGGGKGAFGGKEQYYGKTNKGGGKFFGGKDAYNQGGKDAYKHAGGGCGKDVGGYGGKDGYYQPPGCAGKDGYSNNYYKYNSSNQGSGKQDNYNNNNHQLSGGSCGGGKENHMSFQQHSGKDGYNACSGGKESCYNSQNNAVVYPQNSGGGGKYGPQHSMSKGQGSKFPQAAAAGQQQQQQQQHVAYSNSAQTSNAGDHVAGGYNLTTLSKDGAIVSIEQQVPKGNYTFQPQMAVQNYNNQHAPAVGMPQHYFAGAEAAGLRESLPPITYSAGNSINMGNNNGGGSGIVGPVSVLEAVTAQPGPNQHQQEYPLYTQQQQQPQYNTSSSNIAQQGHNNNNNSSNQQGNHASNNSEHHGVIPQQLTSPLCTALYGPTSPEVLPSGVPQFNHMLSSNNPNPHYEQQLFTPGFPAPAHLGQQQNTGESLQNNTQQHQHNGGGAPGAGLVQNQQYQYHHPQNTKVQEYPTANSNNNNNNNNHNSMGAPNFPPPQQQHNNQHNLGVGGPGGCMVDPQMAATFIPTPALVPHEHNPSSMNSGGSLNSGGSFNNGMVMSGGCGPGDHGGFVGHQNHGFLSITSSPNPTESPQLSCNGYNSQQMHSPALLLPSSVSTTASYPSGQNIITACHLQPQQLPPQQLPPANSVEACFEQLRREGVSNCARVVDDKLGYLVSTPGVI